MLISIRWKLRPGTVSPHSDTMISRPWPMHSGKREAARKDPHKRIGFMPPNNYDPAPTPVNLALGDHRCPKCDVEMEPTETAADGPPLQQLELCPSCYLVMWSDQAGLHVRQGVPMN